jgi:hypothetical protein
MKTAETSESRGSPLAVSCELYLYRYRESRIFDMSRLNRCLTEASNCVCAAVCLLLVFNPFKIVGGASESSSFT